MRPIALISLLTLAGCVSVSIEPIKIEHTITLKIERAVDDLLDDLYGEDDPANEPTTQQAQPETETPNNPT